MKVRGLDASALFVAKGNTLEGDVFRALSTVYSLLRTALCH